MYLKLTVSAAAALAFAVSALGQAPVPGTNPAERRPTQPRSSDHGCPAASGASLDKINEAGVAVKRHGPARRTLGPGPAFMGLRKTPRHICAPHGPGYPKAPQENLTN